MLGTSTCLTCPLLLLNAYRKQAYLGANKAKWSALIACKFLTVGPFLQNVILLL